MTEQEWLTCEDPRKMLSSYSVLGEGKPRVIVAGTYQEADRSEGIRISDRKLRLFACGCARQGLLAHPDKRDLKMVKAAEQHADDGNQEPFDSAHEFYERSTVFHHSETWLLTMRCFWSARYIVEEVERSYPYLAPTVQANILRDIIGNPWRPLGVWGGDLSGNLFHWLVGPGAVSVSPPWLTPTVLAIASHAYDKRDYEALPILADALEESGCESEDLLRHLRGQERCTKCLGTGTCGPSWDGEDSSYLCACGDGKGSGWIPLCGPHVRGCWALDLLLGKE